MKRSSVGKEHHSSTGGQNSPQKLIDVSEEQKEDLINLANEHEFPALSANSSSKSNRRNQNVGGMEEQGGKQTSLRQSNNALLGSHSNNRPRKLPYLSVSKKKHVSVEQTSTRSSSYPDESSYPTIGFQEGQSHSASGRPKLGKNGPQGGPTPENQGDNMLRPFDICFYTRKQPVIQRPPCSQMDSSSVIENGEILRPGMVLFKRYIPIWQQVSIKASSINVIFSCFASTVLP